MADAARGLSHVEAVTGSSEHIGHWYGTRKTVTIDDASVNTAFFRVGENYFDVLRPPLLYGTYPTLPGHILINKSLAQRLPHDNPAGRTINLEDTDYVVSGVTTDFHYSNFSDTIEPAVFYFGDPTAFRMLVLKYQSGAEEALIASMTAAWKAAFPDQDLMYYFQDESFHSFFEEGQGIGNIFSFTAIVALILSCAGLFGLATQHMASKMKEMSIRKILGATAVQIVRIGNRQFLLILLLALVVAAPLGYFMLWGMLESFIAYRMPLGPAPFLVAAGLLALIAAGTISSQIYRLATVNPAELLRNE